MTLRMLLFSALFTVSYLQAAEPQTATFAGGCFWCVEEAFDKVDGVLDTTSGYANGNTNKPSYEEVSKGKTGYVESLQVSYDPQRVSFEKLLEVFWHNHDPTDGAANSVIAVTSTVRRSSTATNSNSGWLNSRVTPAQDKP